MAKCSTCCECLNDLNVVVVSFSLLCLLFPVCVCVCVCVCVQIVVESSASLALLKWRQLRGPMKEGRAREQRLQPTYSLSINAYLDALRDRQKGLFLGVQQTSALVSDQVLESGLCVINSNPHINLEPQPILTVAKIH